MKKIIIMLAAAIVALSCEKDDVMHDEIIGLNYSGGGYEVQITSATKLIWTLSNNRSSAMSYTIDYQFENNSIQFFVEDEVNGGLTEVNDSFYGSFSGTKKLIGDKIIHNYTKYSSGGAFEGDGGSEQKGITLKQK